MSQNVTKGNGNPHHDEDSNNTEHKTLRTLLKWFSSYSVQRKIRLMLAGFALLIITSLYITFQVPNDGIIDIRESMLGVGGIVTGTVMVFWPFLRAILDTLRDTLGYIASFIVTHVLKPTGRWIAELFRGRRTR